jgi:hypothetical protein
MEIDVEEADYVEREPAGRIPTNWAGRFISFIFFFFVGFAITKIFF